MANKNKEENIHLSQFDDDILILNKEMADIDGLFNDVQSIFKSMVKDPTRIEARMIPNVHKLIESLTSLKNNKAGLIKERINIKKLAEDIDIKHKNADAKSGEVAGLGEIVEHLRHITVTPDQVNASDSEIAHSEMSEEEIDAQLLASLEGEEMPTTNVDHRIISENDEPVTEIEEEFDIDSLELEDNIDIEPDTVNDESTEENSVVITSSDDLPEDLYLVVTRYGKVLVINSDYEIVDGYDTSEVKINIDKNDNGDLIAIDINGNYEIEIVDDTE